MTNPPAAPPPPPPGSWSPPPAGAPGQPYPPPGTPYPPPGYPQMVGGPPCPRCHSSSTKKGGIPVWAIVLAIVFCPIGLLFLLIKEDSVCHNCGMTWKT